MSRRRARPRPTRAPPGTRSASGPAISEPCRRGGLRFTLVPSCWASPGRAVLWAHACRALSCLLYTSDAADDM
eukprot:13104324-Alexandrium_andersonii.AAC.1